MAKKKQKQKENWEWSSLFYIEQLNRAAAAGRTQSYQFGNCRFDCKQTSADRDIWEVHAHDTEGNDCTMPGMSTFHVGRMMSDLYGTFGSGIIKKQ